MNISTVESLITPERSELIRAFNQDLLPPVVAVDWIELLMETIPLKGEGLEPIKGVRQGNGYIWRYQGVTSCWVAAHYSGYRGAYSKYLTQVFGFKGDVGDEIDIDHLFNQGRGKKMAKGYLRVFPVSKVINRQHGSIFERRATSSEKERKMKTMHFMSFIALLKVMGVKPPRDYNDTHGLNEAVTAICASGDWQRSDVEQSLLNLMTRLEKSHNVIVVKV